MTTLPVTNAFCNCPLNPVFQGPMDLAALLLQMQMIAIIMMSKRSPKKMATIYFQLSRDFPESGTGISASPWSGPGPVPLSCCGGDVVEDGATFPGTAGNDPLLLLLGWAITLPNGAPPLAGAAARLFDPSSNLRRVGLGGLSRVWIMCGLGEPAKAWSMNPKWVQNPNNLKTRKRILSLTWQIIRVAAGILVQRSLSKIETIAERESFLRNAMLWGNTCEFSRYFSYPHWDPIEVTYQHHFYRCQQEIGFPQWIPADMPDAVKNNINSEQRLQYNAYEDSIIYHVVATRTYK